MKDNMEKPNELDYANLLPIMDVNEGLGRLRNNKKLYFTLLKSFSGRQMADDLIGFINSGNFEKAAQTAHAIKGVAANLSLNELNKVASDIEGRAKKEENAGDLIPALDEVINASMQAINTLLESEGAK